MPELDKLLKCDCNKAFSNSFPISEKCRSKKWIKTGIQDTPFPEVQLKTTLNTTLNYANFKDLFQHLLLLLNLQTILMGTFD